MKQKGSCHCGKVSFEVELDLNSEPALICNCSMCQRKGTALRFVPDSQFQLLSGEGQMTDYQFGKKTIHHLFCSTCGVTAFASGQMPDGTKIKAINVRCLENVDMGKLQTHSVDGKNF
ncbi:GFA family protein [Pseudobdellovibrio exovorus]|uniref:CENP-V/GFA domain-containing protein n=1 Tax=Pseudobdellovibrio exovorus JSS TaxID=1184267 RepID=M4VN69_9BACT|nr:GFA family protein [Pseudobdellovibrio exovorus]AGH94519.1 hypothetical protein A11Q_299 [Pseudobdellovibrio exovorus JSS]